MAQLQVNTASRSRTVALSIFPLKMLWATIFLQMQEWSRSLHSRTDPLVGFFTTPHGFMPPGGVSAARRGRGSRRSRKRKNKDEKKRGEGEAGARGKRQWVPVETRRLMEDIELQALRSWYVKTVLIPAEGDDLQGQQLHRQQHQPGVVEESIKEFETRAFLVYKRMMPAAVLVRKGNLVWPELMKSPRSDKIDFDIEGSYCPPKEIKAMLADVKRTMWHEEFAKEQDFRRFFVAPRNPAEEMKLNLKQVYQDLVKVVLLSACSEWYYRQVYAEQDTTGEVEHAAVAHDQQVFEFYSQADVYLAETVLWDALLAGVRRTPVLQGVRTQEDLQQDALVMLLVGSLEAVEKYLAWALGRNHDSGVDGHRHWAASAPGPAPLLPPLVVKHEGEKVLRRELEARGEKLINEKWRTVLSRKLPREYLEEMGKLFQEAFDEYDSTIDHSDAALETFWEVQWRGFVQSQVFSFVDPKKLIGSGLLNKILQHVQKTQNPVLVSVALALSLAPHVQLDRTPPGFDVSDPPPTMAIYNWNRMPTRASFAHMTERKLKTEVVPALEGYVSRFLTGVENHGIHARPEHGASSAVQKFVKRILEKVDRMMKKDELRAELFEAFKAGGNGAPREWLARADLLRFAL
ncbi:unnamed protein product [Amoebophrya sp. A120]|nr:unnamed protein product [Amoebophrya sp. A120]|eukprot:GSA120T00019180001.1